MSGGTWVPGSGLPVLKVVKFAVLGITLVCIALVAAGCATPEQVIAIASTALYGG